MLISEFREHDVVAPVAGDVQHAGGKALFAESAPLRDDEARGVVGLDVGLNTVQAKASRWRRKG